MLPLGEGCPCDHDEGDPSGCGDAALAMLQPPPIFLNKKKKKHVDQGLVWLFALLSRPACLDACTLGILPNPSRTWLTPPRLRLVPFESMRPPHPPIADSTSTSIADTTMACMLHSSSLCCFDSHRYVTCVPLHAKTQAECQHTVLVLSRRGRNLHLDGGEHLVPHEQDPVEAQHAAACRCTARSAPDELVARLAHRCVSSCRRSTDRCRRPAHHAVEHQHHDDRRHEPRARLTRLAPVKHGRERREQRRRARRPTTHGVAPRR